MSYQGVLTDESGNPVSSTTHNLTFKLYDAATDGTELWTETQSVDISNGLFNVILGNVNPLTLDFDMPCWLGITIDSGSELSPRVELTASAYSLNARGVLGSSNVFPSSGAVSIGATNSDPNTMLHVEGCSDKPSGILGVAHYGSSSARPFGIIAGCSTNNSATTGGGFYSSIRSSENPNINYLFSGQLDLTVEDEVNARTLTVVLDGASVDTGDYALEVKADEPGYAIYSSGSGKNYLNGDVGIGTEQPGNILTIQQNSAIDPVADAWTTYSSKRWKTNIKPIEGAIEKINRLRGVSFDWKEDGKHDIGLIAEEVGKVILEIVVFEENSIDAKSVDYARLVALLIEALKDQQTQINDLKASLSSLQ